MHHAAHIANEAHRHRVVELQLLAHPGDRRRIGAFPDDCRDRITGREVEQREGDRQDPEQGRHQQAEPQCDVANHGVTVVSMVTRVQRWPVKTAG